jgi:hypothetical protein
MTTSQTVDRLAADVSPSAETPTQVSTFGATFMTSYDTDVVGYDPRKTRSNWTTNEDNAG